VILLLEFFVRRNAIAAYTQYSGFLGLESLDFITEITCFLRSAGSVVLGIEVKD
jgi:hypothetical protein